MTAIDKRTGWHWGAPRLITRAQLRSYLQMEEAEFAARLKTGQVPKPVFACDAELPSARWDRQAVDRALDRASAIPSHLAAAEEELDDAFGLNRSIHHGRR